MFETESDYMVKVLLELLKACSQNEGVPFKIVETFASLIYYLIHDKKEITLAKEHI